MGSLTTRFAALLIASVIGVVVLAAVITSSLARGPGEDQFGRAMAEKALLALDLFKVSPEAARAAGVQIGGKPDSSSINPDITERIGKTLSEIRKGTELVVLEDRASGRSRLAVKLPDDQWAYLAFPHRPSFPWKSLTLYLTVIAVGVGAIAIYSARRMMQPFRMLESTITSIGPDGTIPVIPEKGPPEVRVTAGAINRLSRRLNAAVESRMRLIAAAGHDLRTPMTRMRLRAEFFDDDEREFWLKDIDELDRIADSAIRLVREEVSDDSRQPVRIDRLAEEVVREIRDLGHDAVITQVAPATALAMPLALKRAVRNLAINAATHGGGVRVTVKAAADSVRVSFEDDGPGIPEPMIHRVFEPFFRVDEARRKFHPGAGLGLAISREIIAKNGGTLEIANRPEGGLRQVVVLPAAQAEA